MKKIIFIVLISISLFNCRVAKKDWVKENYTEKSEINSLKSEIANYTETLETKISESVNKQFSEKLKQETESTSENENETIIISGSIIAEDGKEKSVTAGGLTITTNGANVTFETITNKSISKEFESKYQELHQQLNTEREFNQTLQLEITSLEVKFENFVSNYESEKTTKTKSVTKTGFQFGVWIIIAIVIIIIIIIWYFRKSIPFLN